MHGVVPLLRRIGYRQWLLADRLAGAGYGLTVAGLCVKYAGWLALPLAAAFGGACVLRRVRPMGVLVFAGTVTVLAGTAWPKLWPAGMVPIGYALYLAAGQARVLVSVLALVLALVTAWRRRWPSNGCGSPESCTTRSRTAWA